MAKTNSKQHKRHPKKKRPTLLFWIVCLVALGQLGIVLYVSRLGDRDEPTSVYRPPRSETGGLVQYGRRAPTPTLNPESVLLCELGEETEVFGTVEGVVALGAGTEVRVLREASLNREQWAQVQFEENGETRTGWVASDTILWPQDAERSTTKNLSMAAVAQLRDAVFDESLRRGKLDSSSVTGLNKAQFLQALSSEFEVFHERPSSVGEVRLMGRHADDDSLLILECTGEQVHQALLTLAGDKTSAADPLCDYLSERCPEAGRALLALLSERGEGEIDCPPIGRLEVSRASEFTWILLSPPS